MNKSESIANLALALNLAQQQMGGAVKDLVMCSFQLLALAATASVLRQC